MSYYNVGKHRASLLYESACVFPGALKIQIFYHMFDKPMVFLSCGKSCVVSGNIVLEIPFHTQDIYEVSLPYVFACVP